MPPANLEEIITDIKRIGFNEWLSHALVAAFKDARKGKLKTHDEHSFEVNWMQNITKLQTSILECTYEPSASVAFVIFEPMIREIFAAPFRDRIVHPFLYNMQAGWWDRRFIYDSYSCREYKGTLFGIKRAQKLMRQASAGGAKEAYIVKLDLKGYFMSLPRTKLYARVRWGLDQQFKDYKNDPAGYRLYRTCDYLWRKILFDDPASKAWRRGSIHNWDPDVLPPEKSLFTQQPGYGIVIGNLTSQLVSNIYLDQLDRFVKFDLGYKYYGRYVDDFFIIVPATEYAKVKTDIKKIEVFLKSELGLTLHTKKRYYQPVEKGMSFLGARVYLNALYPSDRLQKKFHISAEKFAYGYKDVDSIISYLGLMKHLDAHKYLERAFDNMGWDYHAPGENKNCGKKPKKEKGD